MKKIGLTGWILIAMGLGTLTGLVSHYTLASESAERFSSALSVVTDIFLRLIKMIIAPLVFTTLVVGIAKLGDIKAVGRIGAKTLVWFLSASVLSLLLGLIIMNLTKLGQPLHLPHSAENTVSPTGQPNLSFRNFITHVFPSSLFEAMANNEILQIVVFSIFFGTAAAALGSKAAFVVKGLDAVAQIILKMTGYVMNFAPVAAFSAIAAILSTRGPSVLVAYGKFILTFYVGVLVLWSLLLLAGYLIIGKRVFQLITSIKNVVLLAFSTASSEAAFPGLIEELEQYGCPSKIVSFVLPLGYSFNLDGSMLYMTFASLFIAQAYGVPMSLGQQLSMLVVLMVTSKGIAGVPRAALVVVSGTLALFNIPQQGLLLLLGIDQILDMARSATNVVGNSVAAAVVSKMENALGSGMQSRQVESPIQLNPTESFK